MVCDITLHNNTYFKGKQWHNVALRLSKPFLFNVLYMSVSFDLHMNMDFIMLEFFGLKRSPL